MSETVGSAVAGTLRKLDPRAITLWRLSTLGSGAIFLLVAVGAEFVLDTGYRAGYLALPVAIAAVMAAALLPPMRYEAWAFALREEHLYLRHGVLFRTTSLVPYARIQHVDTRHGPVDRWLGLATLVVFTAGTRGAIVTIPALRASEAEQLRDHLAALSGAGDAV